MIVLLETRLNVFAITRLDRSNVQESLGLADSCKVHLRGVLSYLGR